MSELNCDLFKNRAYLWYGFIFNIELTLSLQYKRGSFDIYGREEQNFPTYKSQTQPQRRTGHSQKQENWHTPHQLAKRLHNVISRLTSQLLVTITWSEMLIGFLHILCFCLSTFLEYSLESNHPNNEKLSRKEYIPWNVSKQLLLDIYIYINNYPLVSSESRRKSLMVCHFWLPKIKTMESDLANVRIFFQGNTVESLKTQLCRNQHDLHRLVQVGSGLPSALLPH